MAVYTVHEPPARRGQAASDPARFAFVRDGFSFWAFLLGPLWMLWHRLWLVLLGYVIVAAALQTGLALVGAGEVVKIAAAFLLALLIGFEASSLRRWTLARRRWRSLGVVVADDLEMAERRFFDAWSGEGVRDAATASPSRRSAASPPPPAASSAPPEVIGLFPQPGARP